VLAHFEPMSFLLFSAIVVTNVLPYS